LDEGNHYNSHLQAAYKNYGALNFSFTIIEITAKSNIIEREQFWIDTLDSTNPKKGYNRRKIANSNFGIIHTDQSRKKMSIGHIGLKRSKEAQEKISKSQYKPVIQIDFQGNIIKEFPSMIVAAKEINCKRTGISMCCSGRIKTAGGYHWCKKSDMHNFVLPDKKFLKKINHAWKIKNGIIP
jgi:hypothetical protein